MNISCIVENVSRVGFDGAHGLSLLIESGGQTILFDFGPDGPLLLRNAEKLHIDLNRVDLAILSHGHYDHSGGMEAFLTVNDHAPVYVQRDAFLAHWSESKDALRYIGADRTLPERFTQRIRYVDERLDLPGGLTLFSHVPMADAPSLAYAAFREDTDAGRVQDQFHHEMNLLLREDGVSTVFSGCAHQGILNILRTAEALDGTAPDAVVAGLHLMGETEDFTAEVGRALKKRGLRCWTGHCTGVESYGVLKGILGDRVHYLASGQRAALGGEA